MLTPMLNTIGRSFIGSVQGKIHCDLVVPALMAAMEDPAISDPAGFSLSMVRQFVCAQAEQ